MSEKSYAASLPLTVNTSYARPIVCAIGGNDNGGAAGLSTDLKTMMAFGVHATSVVTAVTAQNLTQCFQISKLAASEINSQLNAFCGQLSPKVIKTGLLPSAAICKEIAHFIRSTSTPLICDPVLNASSGAALADPEVIQVLRQELIPLTTLLTPNLDEAEALVGFPLRTPFTVQKAAEELLSLGCHAVLIKGGHAQGDTLARDFYLDGHSRFWLAAPRLAKTVRGTGCTLASAVASALAFDFDLLDAVVLAKAYVRRGIRLAYGFSSDGGLPQLLQHQPWPVSAEDMPWMTAAEQDFSWQDGGAFPVCSAAELGFYPLVETSEWLRRLLAIDVKTLQLRQKNLKGVALENEIERATDLARAASARLFVNDHWQLAIKYQAYGIHLGQEDLAQLTTDDWRRLQQSGLRLGISTHSYSEAARAHAYRPSYLALGPIFPTTCKSMRFGPQGMERLKEWVQIWPYPIVAIGGLRLEHADELRRLGVSAAVVSDVRLAASPEERGQAWLRKLFI